MPGVAVMGWPADSGYPARSLPFEPVGTGGINYRANRREPA